MPRSLGKHTANLERDRRKKKVNLTFLNHVNVIDFLENFDIANISQASADEVQFSCPFPDHSRGDSTPSAYMNDGSRNPKLTTRWKCFGCGREGSAISFYAEYQGVSHKVAGRHIKEHYAPGHIKPKFGSIAREFEARRKGATKRHSVTVNTIDAVTLRRFDVDWSHFAEDWFDSPDVAYMLDRGFTPGDLDDWGIGYDDISKRITIPVCDPEGNLVGFKGRAWRKQARPKYLVLGDKDEERERYGFPTYDKSLVVFGLHRYADSDSQSLVLVEGEIDVMSLWVMGIPAICCGGSSMSPAQARLIRQYCDEVILFFDNDVAGKNAIYGYEKKDGEHKPGVLELLEPFIRVKVVGRHRRDANDYLRRGEHDRVRSLIDNAISSHLL